MVRKIFICIFCFPSFFLFSQIDCIPVNSNVIDGSFNRQNVNTRRPVVYPPLREADVMWLKRIWRRIDLRQKQNMSLYYPEKPVNDRKSLFDLIKCGILYYGTITAYDPGPLGSDDQFLVQLTTEDVLRKLSKVDTVWTVDPITFQQIAVPVSNDVESSQIKWYDIKEEWFFDNQRSQMDVRIIGICPLKEKIDPFTGEFRGLEPLFWIYFPELRYTLSNSGYYNKFNDILNLSYDDIFTKRLFHSIIIKESNVYDRFINEYESGIEALLEAERIKEDIFSFENDLWHY